MSDADSTYSDELAVPLSKTNAGCWQSGFYDHDIYVSELCKHFLQLRLKKVYSEEWRFKCQDVGTKGLKKQHQNNLKSPLT